MSCSKHQSSTMTASRLCELLLLHPIHLWCPLYPHSLASLPSGQNSSWSVRVSEWHLFLCFVWPSIYVCFISGQSLAWNHNQIKKYLSGGGGWSVSAGGAIKTHKSGGRSIIFIDSPTLTDFYHPTPEETGENRENWVKIFICVWKCVCV